MVGNTVDGILMTGGRGEVVNDVYISHRGDGAGDRAREQDMGDGAPSRNKFKFVPGECESSSGKLNHCGPQFGKPRAG